MIVRAVDSDNDWMFGSGLQSYKKELAAIEQGIKTRVQSWKGDSFSSPAEGVDWNNYLGVGTKDLLDADIKRVILQSEGVLRMTSYSSTLDRDSRDITIQAEIITIYGADLLNLEV